MGGEVMPISPGRSLNKTKVCFFCERWESGGIESFLSNVLHCLDLETLQADIVAACLCQSVFTEPLKKLGVRFFELSGDQRNLIQNHKLFSALLETEQYAVVHINAFHGLSLYYARLAMRAGVPMRIAHSHNASLRKSATKPLKLLIHKMAKELYVNDATDLWACSKSAAEFLFPQSALRAKGVEFIPNGIEASRFRFKPEVREQVRAELGLEGNFVIGNVGRLCSQKNQDFLLDVFAQVRRGRPESRLLLVGEGELMGALKVKAKRLGIAREVIFFGVSSHVERLLWAMDVFAFPSRFEGLGIAAVEAQATGLPVLGSECIPDEACVTPRLQRLELKTGPARWAQALLELECGLDGRQTGVDQVRHIGFDINDVSRMMMKYFERGAGQRQ